MKIVLIENADKWSGACYKVMLLAKELVSKGYEITVVTKPDTIVTEMFIESGIEIYPCSIKNDADIFAFFRLRKLFSLFKPDIVEIFNQKAYWIGAVLCKLMGIKCVINRNIDWLTKRKKLLSFLLRHFTCRVVAVSEFVKNVVHNELNYPQKNIKVIYSCKEMRLFEKNDGKSNLRKELGLHSDTVIFTYIGRLAPEKGLVYLIKAFVNVIKKKPQSRLVIVGDGDERFIKTLSALIRNNHLTDSVFMLGFRRDVINILNATDIFVHPSIYEALSQSIIEAMASGQLVIATNTGGIPEYIRNDENGFLVEPGNQVELENKMIYVMENKHRLTHISDNARTDVISKFDKKNFINDYIDFYESLINL